MLDCSFSGITLAKEPSHEADALISIYTKEFGKIIAFAQGCRKPASKLSAHLEPGRLIRGRLIEKMRIRIVDAVTENSFPNLKKHGSGFERALALLASIRENTGEFEPDENLWNFCNYSLVLLSGASTQPRTPLLGFATLDLHIHSKLREVLGC